MIRLSFSYICSLLLTFFGIYLGYSSYLTYLARVESIPNSRAMFVLPVTEIIVSISFVVVGVMFFLFKKWIDSVVAYPIKSKAFWGVAVFISFLSIPVSNVVFHIFDRDFCYGSCALGLPLPFWILTDYTSLGMTIFFFIGLLVNSVFWLIILSVLAYFYGKFSKNQRIIAVILFSLFSIVFSVGGFLKIQDSPPLGRANIAATQGTLAGVIPAAIICLDDQGTLQYRGAGSDTPITGSALCSEGDTEWPILPNGWDYEAGATQDGGQDFNFSATSDGGKGASGAERVSCSIKGCLTMTIDSF